MNELLRKFIKETIETRTKCTCVVIVSGDKRVLAVSRKDDPTVFTLVGGHVDPHESFEEAAARELEEETGLVASRLSHVLTAVDDDGNLTRTFVARVDGEIDTPESGLVRWVEPGVLVQDFCPRYNKKVLKKLGLLGETSLTHVLLL